MKSVELEKLIRPHLKRVQTYAALDPSEVLAQKGGVPLDQVIRLNGNENPYACSPKVAQALASDTSFHIYPDPRQRKVRDALSEYTGLGPEHIIVGNGSDEIIDLLLRLLLEPGDSILDCDPTFGMYAFTARICGGGVISVPRDELFEIDPEAVKNAVDSKTKVVFVTSPNNPTGNTATEEQVKALLETGIIVAVDETYFEFAQTTVTHLVPEYDNLVILRTLSKWAGLAGLRIGYGIMSPELVEYFIDIKPPYNINVAAETGLLASLEDVPHLLENVQRIVEERDRLFSILEKMESVVPWPSGGNFLLVQFTKGNAQAVFEGLAQRGIFVRQFNQPRLQDFLRITAGLPEHTDALVHALEEVV